MNNKEQMPYNLEDAQEEASKMQEKVESGEAKDYNEAEEKVEQNKQLFIDEKHNEVKPINNQFKVEKKSKQQNQKNQEEDKDFWKKLPRKYLHYSSQEIYSSVGEVGKRLFEAVPWSNSEMKNLNKEIEMISKEYKEFPKVIGLMVDALKEIAYTNNNSQSSISRKKYHINKSLKFFRNKSSQDLIIDLEKNYCGNEASLISRINEITSWDKENFFTEIIQMASNYKKAPYFMNWIARKVIYAENPEKYLNYFSKPEIQEKLINIYTEKMSFLIGLRNLVKQNADEEEFYKHIEKEKKEIITGYNRKRPSRDILDRIYIMRWSLNIGAESIFEYFSQTKPSFASKCKKIEEKAQITCNELYQTYAGGEEMTSRNPLRVALDDVLRVCEKQKDL